MNKYQKYEFCSDIECLSFELGACQNAECSHTAKEFHHWLSENGFEILRMAVNANQPTMCSICEDKVATDESAYNHGTFYCSNCANYVAAEYGANRLRRILR